MSWCNRTTPSSQNWWRAIVAAVRGTEAGVYFGSKGIEISLVDQIEPPQAAINRIAASVSAGRKPKPVRSFTALAAAMNLQNSA